MNDLQKLYDVLVRDGYYTKSFDEFKVKWQDQTYQDKVYGVVSRDGLFTKSKDEFLSKYSGQQEPLKKKEPTVSASKLEEPTSVSSTKKIEEPVKPKPVTTKVGNAEIVKGYPSNPNKEYKFENGVWYDVKYTPTTQKPTKEISKSGAVIQKGGAPNLDIQSQYTQIKDPSRVAELNRYFKKQASTSTEFKTFTGLPGNENREYRVSDGNWVRKDKGKDNWVTITNEDNIAYLNSQFNQDVKPFSSKAEVERAKDYNNLEKQFQNNLSYINSKLVDQSEESVVPKLQTLFPAFKFEQSRAGADRVMVTAPNGNKEEFLLDNYTWSQDKAQADLLRGWLNTNYDPKVAKEEAELRRVEKTTEDKVERVVLPGGGSATTVTPSFVDRDVAFPIIEKQAKKERSEYYAAKSEQVKEVYNKYSDYVNKTGKVDDLEARQALAELKADDAELKRLNAYQDDIRMDIQDYSSKKQKAAIYLNDADTKLRTGEITQEQYDAQYKPQIEQMEADLKSQQTRIEAQTQSIGLVKKSAEKAAAENYLIQEAKGSFGGGLAYSSIKALTALPRLALGIMNIESKDIAENAAKEFGLYTTKEYMESEERSDLAKAAFAITESAVASVAGGATAGNLALYGMGYYEMKDELDQIEGMTEQQKMIMAGAYGMVSAALNKFGLEAALGKVSSATGKSVKTFIMKNVFSSLPKDASKEVIEAAVMNETKKYLTSAGLDVAGSMIVEGVTEASENLAGATIKELYDIGKETNYFNKEGAAKVFEDALYEGYLGALGGGIMSGIYNTTQAGIRGLKADSDELKMLMKAAETEGMQSAVLASVKADMLSGKINKEQAQTIVNNFQEVKSKVDQMPDGITDEGKSVALSLMVERDELNKQKEGKDPNLVKPITDRINEINDSLQQIPLDYAVQKPSTDEIPVQPTPGVSEEMEGGTPQPTTEQITEEVVGEEVVSEPAETEQAKAETVEEEVTAEEAPVAEEVVVEEEAPEFQPAPEKKADFDRMMTELNGVIEKSQKRNVSQPKVLENAINYLQGSKVYEEASDVEREQMVRDVRKMLGQREKSAPSVKKLFGEAKNVKMITMPEYDLMVKGIKDYGKGAKDAKSAFMKVSGDLTKYLKNMTKSGSISTTQAGAVLRKFSGVNMLNEKSVENFVDYMRKVFDNADYAQQISDVRKKLPTAKKNIKSKIGVAEAISPMMQKVFSVNPNLIPDSVFNKYAEIVNKIGERTSVLKLEDSNKVKADLVEILDAIELESGLATELQDLYEENVIVSEEGKADFSETVNTMLQKNLINEYEASLMKKYRSMFTEPQKRESKKEENKQDAIEYIEANKINSSELGSKDERKLASDLQKMIDAKAYEMLDSNEIVQLAKTIDNLNNGFVTHRAQRLLERMNGLTKKKKLVSPINAVKVMFGELVSAKLRSKYKNKNIFTYIIEGNSAAFIDEVFGNFKERPFYENIFEPLATAISKFQSENRIQKDKIENLETSLAKSYNFNGNKIKEAKYKIMTYLIQLEHDSNPGNKQVNQSADFLRKTIEYQKEGRGRYSERDSKIFEQILEDYKADELNDKGETNIDKEKLYDSFTPTEKAVIKGLRDINDSLTEKSMYTAAVIRGNRIDPLNNYTSLVVLDNETGGDAITSINELRNVFDATRNTSSKAKNLIERTGTVSALEFDPFSSVRKSSSAVLMDYTMTPAIREGRITLKALENDVKSKDGDIDKSKTDLINALRDAYSLIVDNAIGNSMIQGTREDAIISEINKQGYRVMLASVERFMAEVMSNATFVAFVAPLTWSRGTKYSKFMMSGDFFNLLKNVNSTMTNRIKPANTLSDRMVSSEMFDNAVGIKGSGVNSNVANAAQMAYNLTLKKVKNTADIIADNLVSTPDKLMMQPLWMGKFAEEFEKESGTKLDEKKIAENDEAYMNKYADAIEKAKREADDITLRAGSTENAALTVLRNTIKPEQKASTFWKWYKTFNGFMSKFLLFEYMTARSAIYQLANDGRISKSEATRELAAVATRMTMYSVVISMLGNSMVDMAANLLGYRDDEEEDEDEDKKTLAQEVGQGLASTFTTMMFGRNFGNVARAPINIGIEYMNEKYLDFLRNGEYDAFTDNIQYTILPIQNSKSPATDIALNTLGPISPFVKTANFTWKYFAKEKKPGARKEGVRVATEIPGSLGFVPFYSDIRKIEMDWLYGDLKNANKITSKNIASKIKSAKASMTKDIREAVMMQSNKEISAEEMNEIIQQSQKEFLEKINDYQKRLKN
jgi:hypothetical protein